MNSHFKNRIVVLVPVDYIRLSDCYTVKLEDNLAWSNGDNVYLCFRYSVNACKALIIFRGLLALRALRVQLHSGRPCARCTGLLRGVK